ncbi:peptidoglycan-binding domain-containing protein [Actinokineospora sp. NPDC004072]
MGNPELRQGSDQEDWVKYLQGLLANRLAAAAAAGEVRLSLVDGRFGPVTEASVEFFQTRAGLIATGVVDDATWEALEREPEPDQQPAAQQPIDLHFPVQLWLRWPETTFERVVDDFRDFDLTTHPNAQLQIGGSGVGPLAGNGAVELLNREIRLWPNWFLRHTHQFTLDWSHEHGFELGLENEGEIGYRPVRNLEMLIQGQVGMRYFPQEKRGELDWGVGVQLRMHFDLPR